MKEKYQLHPYWRTENVKDFVETIGEKYKGMPAYRFRLKPHAPEATVKNYDELRGDVRALGSELIARGFAGKHITLVAKMSYNWILVYYATLAIGSVLVPLDSDWTAADLADTAKRADTDLVICEVKGVEKGAAITETCDCGAPLFLDGDGDDGISALVEAGRVKFNENSAPYFEAPVDVDKMSLLVFTSGTTGKGKGVMLCQRNFMTCLESVIPYINFSTRTMNVLPAHHTYGSSVTIFGQNMIGSDIYISSGQKYLMKEIAEVKPGHLVLVPLYLETFDRKITAKIKDQGKEKLVRRMMKISNFLRKIGIDLRRKFFASILNSFGGELNMLISGGAAINQDIINFFDGLGIDVLNGYGITECAPIIAVNYSKHVIYGSVGDVLDIDTVKIDEPNEDGEGEILVKGSNVMLGYYKDEAATKDAFDADGYFRTGDYGKLDKNGILYITGRKKNLIILSNGKNVYPEEIESEFIAIPGVIDIVVYEGKSRRGTTYDAIVAEIYPDKELLAKSGITDAKAYFQKYVDAYNKTAVSYKKIGVLKVREEEFPKNTLRKIMRFKMDMTID